MTQNNQLQVILQEQGIDKTDASKLVAAFGGPFEEAGEVLRSYKDIVVTDKSQTDKMAEAREKRLLLKKARTTVENKRKELKADIVKQGKAIDSVARFVKEQIQPAEEYLELQEKFIEIAEEKERAEVKAARIEKLSKYSDDLSVYNLDEMSEEQFTTLLANLKAQHEAKLAEEKRLEDERIAREAEEEKARAEQAEENARLKAEAEAREKEQAEKDEAERVERERIQKEADEKIAKERAEREKLEQEKRDREAEEARKKAEAEEAERKALLAPDKEKLLKFATAMEEVRTTKLPAMKTKQGQDVVNEIDGIFTRLNKFITTKAGEL